MASKVENTSSKSPQRGFMADQDFFTRYAIVLTVFILFGFVQFSARGFVNIRAVPPLVHFHAAVMVGWLGIFIAQNMLVHRGELAVHRKLGWVATFVAATVAVLGCAVGFQAIQMGRVPPFFSNSYFLALTFVEALVFGAMVAWAVSLRRQTQWHRRVMFGATFLILEPALGRLLPMPLLAGWGEWAILAVQMLFIAVLARHDRRTLGSVHPATAAIASIILAVHLLIYGLSSLPAFASLASSVAAG